MMDIVSLLPIFYLYNGLPIYQVLKLTSSIHLYRLNLVNPSLNQAIKFVIRHKGTFCMKRARRFCHALSKAPNLVSYPGYCH